MAGTRLLISCTFLVSLLGAVALAVLLGLVQQRDLAVTALLPLFPWHGSTTTTSNRRKLLFGSESVSSNSSNHSTTISLPPLRILVPNDYISHFLLQLLEEFNGTFQILKMTTARDEETEEEQDGMDEELSVQLDALCSDASSSSSATAKIATALGGPLDVILCQPFPSLSSSDASQATIVVSKLRVIDSVLIVTLDNTAPHYSGQDTVSLNQLFYNHLNDQTSNKNNKDTGRPRLLVNAIMDVALSDWKAWHDAINRAFSKNNWPAFSKIHVAFQAQDLSSSSSTLSLLDASVHGNGEEKVILDALFPNKQSSADKYTQRINLVIPPRSDNNAVFTKKSWIRGNDFYAIVPNILSASLSPEFSSHEEYDQLLAESLSAVNIYQHFHVAAALAQATVTMDRSFPRFYFKLWLQHMLQTTHANALDRALAAQTAMLHAPRKVLLPDRLVQSWSEGMSTMQHGFYQAATGDYLSALECLEHCRRIFADSILQDPVLLEPLDFPLEQYAAVFAPLIFPLLLPLVFGVMREFKRYKTLSSKQHL